MTISPPRVALDLPINQLRTFLAVARRRSFTRAAEELHLTQPAVSAHIRKLERALGGPLFEQIGRRVSLTPVGQVMSHYAEQVLALEDELRVAIADLQDVVQGVLAIGTSTTIGISMLPALLRRFRDEHPLVQLQVQIGNFPEAVSGLLEGHLDVALMPNAQGPGQLDERLESVPVFSDDLVLVVAPGHRWAQAGYVEPRDLIDEPFVLTATGRLRQQVEQVLVPFAVTPAVVAECNSLIAMARMVEAGIGVSVLSRLAVADELAHGRLCEVRLRGVESEQPIFMLIHRDKHRTPALRAFQAMLPPLSASNGRVSARRE
ncbi:MAG: LysR family transcriptional regulator [Chloroflexi bacterium]|nr:LysR family transcriptional regulator [Chloroflexota bacterium]